MVTKIYPYTVDSHMHLMEMEKKGLDTHSILKECFNNGMKAALDAGVSVREFEKRVYRTLSDSVDEKASFFSLTRVTLQKTYFEFYPEARTQFSQDTT